MTFAESQVFRQMLAELVETSSSWLGHGEQIVTTPELTTRKWSFMFRFPVVGGEKDKAVLVKIARQQGMNLEQAASDASLLSRTERENEMLTSIARVFAADTSQNFSFIRPLAFMERWNALVTEELNCKPLKDFLLTPNMFSGSGKAQDDFELFLKRSAAWLRVYHNGMGQSGYAALKDTGLFDRVNDIFSHLSGVLQTGTMKRVQEAVHTFLQQYGETPIPMAMLHGDFHCSNLLVTSEQKIASLDADCVHGPVFEDIAKLFADLETRSLQMMTNGLFLRKKRLDDLKSIFLEEYFGNTMVHQDVLELFVTIAVLYKLRIDEDVLKQSTGIQKIVRRFVTPWRRYFTLNLVFAHIRNVSDGLKNNLE